MECETFNLHSSHLELPDWIIHIRIFLLDMVLCHVSGTKKPARMTCQTDFWKELCM